MPPSDNCRIEGNVKNRATNKAVEGVTVKAKDNTGETNFDVTDS